MNILVTGCAGFIGMHVTLQLLQRGDAVVGLDNLNDYYDVSLKEARLDQLGSFKEFQLERIDLADASAMKALFSKHSLDAIVHLAAQAGVRYSVDHPEVYVQSNLVGFANVLEGARHAKVNHLVYASSSSVYGGNTKIPFSEDDPVDHPISLYAVTKKSNELMAFSYSHLYNIPTTGLRFFTVYGPWGRPDMSPFLFTRAILEGKPIQVFNQGDMMRDFTYIDDIVEGVVRVLDKPPAALHNQEVASHAPYRLFNIGNHQPVQLLDYISALEKAWGKTTTKELLPMQAGDVQKTMACTKALEDWVGFKPKTHLEEGIEKFVAWYRDFYQVT